MRMGGVRLRLVVLAIMVGTVVSDLTISMLDRRVDLTSQTVRITSSLKVENRGSESVGEVLVAFPESQAVNLAYISAKESKSKEGLAVEPTSEQGKEGAALYAVSLPKALGKGEAVSFEVLAVLSHALRPFPERRRQGERQLVVFQESPHALSPYKVAHQSLTLKLPHAASIESYTKLDSNTTALRGSELRYGPYQDVAPYSYSPAVVVHFESMRASAVAKEVVREVEVSHWGNVQVTEHYDLNHAGALLAGEFSRLEYRASGASALNQLVAVLPPRARSVYYRDAIGNISTSHLSAHSKKTELEIQPRYPMFGGWKTCFTIGYSLPLHDFLFESEDGKRFLDFTFGSPMNDIVIDSLILKVVLPEGSTDISVSTPFPVKQLQETKVSHLDVGGRPVVVLEKKNVVSDHNQYFQVYYKFKSVDMLREPLMLISGFFFLFVAGIVYMHVDMSISKSSASYLAKLQWDDVLATVQEVESMVSRCLAIHDRLEASLRDVSRTGDLQACKAARKGADASLKELTKELKTLLLSLQSSPQATHIYPKVEELVAKERELQERLMSKHATVVDCYEKKHVGKEIENRVALHQNKINTLKLEVDDLLDFIHEI